MNIPTLDHRAKLNRANEHLHALEGAISRYIQQEPYGIVSELNVETGYKVFRVKWRSGPPPECSLAIGDTLFNLKSALDHLVFGLSLMAGPIPNERLPAFPIHITPADFIEKSRRSLRHVSSGARAVIESLQPYHSADPLRHPLALLDQLHERDKHRLLHVVQVAAHRVNTHFVRFAPNSVWEIGSALWASKPMKEDGAVVVQLRPRPNGPPDPESHMNFDLVLDVCFDQAPVVGDASVLETLAALRNHVREVVLPKLEPFLV